MRRDGTRVRRLTDNDDQDWNPKFSPNGRWIAFSSDRRGDHEIFKMRADGTKVRRLTEEIGDDLEPDWSPDGDRIVFVNDAIDPGNVFVMNANGSGLDLLATLGAYPSTPRTPVWSPNGRRIAFVTGDEIWTRPPNDDTGAIRVPVTSGAGNNIGWQPLPRR